MGFKVSQEELRKVTYLQVGEPQGRTVPLFPCYREDGTWELWVPTNGGLQKMRPIAMAEGKYFAKAPQSAADVYLMFFDFMCKRAYWPDIVPLIEGIYDDLQNIGACLAKLDLFYNESKRTGFEARRFVITELEYLFLVCRSLYDLLQECVSTMWPKFKFHDPNLGKHQLPPSFRKMILKNGKPMTKQELLARYLVPQEMADYYLRQAEFFQWLREFRDFVSHSGKSFEFVFSTEKGFAVSIDTKPFSSMSIWSDKNTKPHKLGSVRTLTAHLITSTFKAIEEFTILISQIIIFPTDIAPELRVFIRGPHTANLQGLELRMKQQAWYD